MISKIENIVRQYPKTDKCELQTLKELRDWQTEEFTKFACEFADWYCNGVLNADRRSAKYMLGIFDKL